MSVFNPLFILSFYLCLIFPFALLAQEPTQKGRQKVEQNLDIPLDMQMQSQQAARLSQQKIDGLDQETSELLNQYRQQLAHLNDLKTYNKQLQRQLNTQQNDILKRQTELEELETSKHRIVPHMLRMLEVLEQFVGLDLPFLPEERARRIQQLHDLMDRADINLAEKYRRLIEAYRVEAEYGHAIESYQGQVPSQQGSKTVEFLRLGRIGLYYLSLDGHQAAIWNQQQKQWDILAEKFRAPIKQAILVAKKQIPAELLTLPLQKMEYEP